MKKTKKNFFKIKLANFIVFMSLVGAYYAYWSGVSKEHCFGKVVYQVVVLMPKRSSKYRLIEGCQWAFDNAREISYGQMLSVLLIMVSYLIIRKIITIIFQ